MRLLRVGLIGWTALWAILMALGLGLSEGTPVCEGPLIRSINDSDPPTCGGPVAGLVAIAPVTFLVGVAIVLVAVGLIHVGGTMRVQR